jgi:hypothetical protein
MCRGHDAAGGWAPDVTRRGTILAHHWKLRRLRQVAGTVGGSEEAAFMKSDQTASVVGHHVRLTAAIHILRRASWRRSAGTKRERSNTLGEAVSAFERGASALKAENTALDAESDRLRRHRRYRSRPDDRVDGRLEKVEDPGSDGVIAPQPSDPLRGAGMGPYLVQALSERSGTRPHRCWRTRVWAQLPRAPLIAPVPAPGRVVRSSRRAIVVKRKAEQSASGGRTAAASRRKEPHDRGACHSR